MDIRISGASLNTLRHIDLSLPAGNLLALAGPSGSGKSTLARDTLFAESRRRFLDCLSPAARRMMARPARPEVESIEGLPPALCLEQGLPVSTSRAVLGSITESLDYLRIIYAAIGMPHDPVTGEALTRLSPDEISARLCELLGCGVEVAVEMDKTVGDVAEEFAGRGQGMSAGETTGGLGAYDDFTVGQSDDVRG